jgi:hypothetical protein
VVVRHSKTRDGVRRDFRWFREVNDRTPACKWPDVQLPFGINVMGATCLSLHWWNEIELTESEPGVYKTLPPDAENLGDKWVGYYIELFYEGGQGATLILEDKFTFTTPGYVWPNTLPFADCDSREGTCIS